MQVSYDNNLSIDAFVAQLLRTTYHNYREGL